MNRLTPSLRLKRRSCAEKSRPRQKVRFSPSKVNFSGRGPIVGSSRNSGIPLRFSFQKAASFANSLRDTLCCCQVA